MFLLLFMAGVGNALADHGYGHGYGYGGHATIGAVIGPYWGLGYYPPSSFYYLPYYAPVVVEPPVPPVYIEQHATTPEPAAVAAVPQTNY